MRCYSRGINSNILKEQQDELKAQKYTTLIILISQKCILVKKKTKMGHLITLAIRTIFKKQKDEQIHNS